MPKLLTWSRSAKDYSCQVWMFDIKRQQQWPRQGRRGGRKQKEGEEDAGSDAAGHDVDSTVDDDHIWSLFLLWRWAWVGGEQRGEDNSVDGEVPTPNFPQFVAQHWATQSQDLGQRFCHAAMLLPFKETTL